MNKQYDWPALIAAHAESGLTQAAFCRERGIDPRYFSQRKGQLKRASQAPSAAPVKPRPDNGSQAFVRAMPAASGPAVLELTVACGLLRFREGTDPAYVARLVAVLS